MGTHKGDVCLQFVQKMGTLGKLLTSSPAIHAIFESLTKRSLNKSVEELQRSRDLDVMAILLLSEQINKKYFYLLMESCLDILKDESNEHLHPLIIMNYFLKKLHAVSSGMERGPKIEQQWLELVIN